MRRRTKIVLAITFMVAVLVSAFSYIYISQLLRQQVSTADATASNLTSNLAFLATKAPPDASSTRVDTSHPQAVRRALAYDPGTDPDLNNFPDPVADSS